MGEIGGESDHALRVDGLAKTYGSGAEAVRALDDFSLTVEHGQVVGLLGPNGAGKTTAVKSMLGLVVPDAGTVEIAGVSVHDEPARAYRHVDAMLEGARNVYWRLTVRENLSFFAGLGGVRASDLTDRHDRLLDALGLSDVADTVVNDLSRGMKQKVSLATTLARDVDVVFLDEPTLGLDVESSIELRSELRRLAERENVTVVLCSHDMAVVEAVCDRVVIVQDGRVIADDPVGDLVDVLREKRFTVTVDAPLPDSVKPTLRERFDATVRPGDRTDGVSDGVVAIDATGVDAGEAADLLETLRDSGASLRDVETAEPTLEEVFLRLTDATDGDDGEESARRAGPGPNDDRRGVGEDPAKAASTEVNVDGDA